MNLSALSLMLHKDILLVIEVALTERPEGEVNRILINVCITATRRMQYLY